MKRVLSASAQSVVFRSKLHPATASQLRSISHKSSSPSVSSYSCDRALASMPSLITALSLLSLRTCLLG